jgi:hypothetical protein
MSKIILQCIKENSKLRIRFYCFIDEENKVYKNSYNNNYNCQFPKDIRQEGLFYEIPSSDLSISSTATPFYKVKKGNIKILSQEPNFSQSEENNIKLPFKIYTVEECVCCLDKVPDIVITPCGHNCICRTCSLNLLQRKCPICRNNASSFISC